MKKAQTAKERVIQALLKNLEFLSPFEDWNQEHPLVIEYINAMSELHRVHHGWVHIDEMLSEVDQINPGLIREPLRLRAAIIMHDVVCIPCAKDNEEKSVEFSTKFYCGQNILPISELIMATCHEFPFTKFGDDRDIICDLDLITLGVANNLFERYRMNIAEEYRGYCTPEEFNKGTIDFFKKLFKQSYRSSIYRTITYRSCYELIARENIKRLIAGYGEITS